MTGGGGAVPGQVREDRAEDRRGQWRGWEREDDGGGYKRKTDDRRVTGDEKVWGEKEKRTEFRDRSS